MTKVVESDPIYFSESDAFFSVRFPRETENWQKSVVSNSKYKITGRPETFGKEGVYAFTVRSPGAHLLRKVPVVGACVNSGCQVHAPRIPSRVPAHVYSICSCKHPIKGKQRSPGLVYNFLFRNKQRVPLSLSDTYGRSLCHGCVWGKFQ